MLRTLGSAFVRLGGQLRLGHEVQSLIMEADRCAGVIARSAGQNIAFYADAVVICDGGFQANLDMVGKYISSAPERLLMRNAKSGRGAGIRMAQDVGADVTGMDAFYGHVHHRDAMNTDALWPFPVLDSICAASIVVNGNGERFTDEGMGGIYCANAIASLPDPLSAWVIFDDAIWNGPAREWLLPANPYLISAGAKVISAPSITAIAQATGLNADRLARTITAHNDFLDYGTPQTTARTLSRYRAMPVREGRFHALPLCAGMTYTMGGLRISPEARVLAQNGDVIPGLYAAGASTGGLEGGPMRGYSGGLSKAAIFGKIASETIAGEQA